MHLKDAILLTCLSFFLYGCGKDSSSSDPEIPAPIPERPEPIPEIPQTLVINQDSIIGQKAVSRFDWDEGVDIDGIFIELYHDDNIFEILNITPRTIESPYLIFRSNEKGQRFVKLDMAIPPYTKLRVNTPDEYLGLDVQYYESLPFFKADVRGFQQFLTGTGASTDMERSLMFRYEKEMRGFKYWENTFEYNKFFIEYMYDELETAGIFYTPNIIEYDHTVEYANPTESKSDNPKESKSDNPTEREPFVFLADDSSSFSHRLMNRLMHKPGSEYKRLSDDDSAGGKATVGNGYLMVKQHLVNDLGSTRPMNVYLHEKHHNHGFSHSDEARMTYGWTDAVPDYFQDRDLNFYDTSRYRDGFPVRSEIFKDDSGDTIVAFRWGGDVGEQVLSANKFIVGTSLPDDSKGIEAGVIDQNGVLTPFVHARYYDDNAVIMSENEQSIAVLDLKEFNAATTDKPSVYIRLKPEQVALLPTAYIIADITDVDGSSLRSGNTFVQISASNEAIARCAVGASNNHGPADLFAVGRCIKVTEVGNQSFSAAPSEEVLNALGYSQVNSNENSGNTYATLKYEPNLDAHFGVFKQTSIHQTNSHHESYQGTRGQFARFCAHLADIGFDDKTNWRRASEGEFLELKSSIQDQSHQGMAGQEGWPVAEGYHTATKEGDKFVEMLASQNTNNKWLKSPEDSRYPLCVSTQGERPIHMTLTTKTNNLYHINVFDSSLEPIAPESLSFVSTDESAARVDDRGIVEVLDDSKATEIIAKKGLRHAVYTIYSRSQEWGDDELVIEGRDELLAGESMELTASIGTTPIDVEWDSLTPESLTISEYGVVNAVNTQHSYGVVSASIDMQKITKRIELIPNPIESIDLGNKTALIVPPEHLDPDAEYWHLEDKYCYDYGDNVSIADLEELSQLNDYFQNNPSDHARLERPWYKTDEESTANRRYAVGFSLDSDLILNSINAGTPLKDTYGVICMQRHS